MNQPRRFVPINPDLRMIALRQVKNSEDGLRKCMAVHYSAPKGFVGRNICYAVEYQGVCYGYTVAGSTPMHLPRLDWMQRIPLNEIPNNIFFHVEKIGGQYPERNFVSLVVAKWREQVAEDWRVKYGDRVQAYETLVELPRTGECYRRDGWVKLPQATKGQTCKRIAGKGTDSWSGKRVWDTKNLRPKWVFARVSDYE